MHKLLISLFLFSCSTLFLFANDEDKKTLTDAEAFELIGQLLVSEGTVKFDRLNMSDAEVEAYVAGFRKGIKKKISKKEFAKHQAEITALLRKRMVEYKKPNPPLFL